MFKVKQVDNHMTPVRMLWHSGYWDGFLSGMIEYEGERYWFETSLVGGWEFVGEDVEDEDDESVYVDRIFNVFKLTDEQMKVEDYWHGEFRKYVGVHSDYIDDDKAYNGRRTEKNEHRMEDIKKFYDPYQKRTDEMVLESSQIIGWFSDDDSSHNGIIGWSGKDGN